MINDGNYTTQPYKSNVVGCLANFMISDGVPNTDVIKIVVKKRLSDGKSPGPENSISV